MGTLRILHRENIFFTGREEAGKLLGRALERYKNARPVVLGIPRGGVVTAWELANAISGEMDVVVSHKLGAPGNSEYALGAVSENGEVFLDENVRYMTTAQYIQKERKKQMQLILRRLKEYRAVLPKMPLKGKIAIVTDDGVATGFTMEAALSAVRDEGPAKLIMAVPIGSDAVLERLSQRTDETIAYAAPPDFFSVSQFYLNFPQVEDEEIAQILRAENLRRGNALRRSQKVA